MATLIRPHRLPSQEICLDGLRTGHNCSSLSANSLIRILTLQGVFSDLSYYSHLFLRIFLILYRSNF